MPAIKSVTTTIMSVVLLLLLTVPASAQLPDVGVPDAGLPDVGLPDVGDLTLPDLADLPDIEGLDALDPVLETVISTVTEVLELVEDALAFAPGINTVALQGDDAVDAAIAFSQATFDTNPTVILAREDIFADALAAGALQGLLESPLLLTGSEALDERTGAEMSRLQIRNVLILGSTDAIGDEVVDTLEFYGVNVVRAGGPTRIETATLAAGAFESTTAVMTRAYATDGDDSQAYADLLAVSPWAAENDWPVLLTQSDVLTESVAQHLEGSSITDMVLIGGEGAISPAVEQAINDLGIATRRVAGDNRFGTAVAIANERGFASSADTERLIIAEGGSTRDDVWAPGFTAAAHGARNTAPILLTDGPTVPVETLQFITDGIADNLLDGGPVAICASFVDDIACQALGLLLIGDLTEALGLLDLQLTDITSLLETLTQLEILGLLPPEVVTLLEDITSALDLLNGVLPADVAALIDDITGLIPGSDEEGDAAGQIAEELQGALDLIGDGAADDVIETLPEEVGGLLGGLTGGNDDVEGDAVIDPIEDVVGDVLDGGGLLSP